jgi:surface polysaccharide O-acyltransferase-like enzyme
MERGGKPKNRLVWIDVLRVIAIALVMVLASRVSAIIKNNATDIKPWSAHRG